MSAQRRLAAIMFTDIVGYTSLMARDERGALEVLQKNRDIQRPLIEHFGGQFLKEIGDGVLASFESPSAAVLCAAAIQEKCREADIDLRIGMHQGEVIFQDGDVFGDGVNIASRIEPLGEPGQILISGDIQRNVRNTGGIETSFRSEEQLKHVEGQTRIFEARVDPAVLHDELGEFNISSTHKTPRANNTKSLIRWMIVAFIGVGAGAALWSSISSSDKVEGIDVATVRKFRDMTVAVLPFKGPATHGLEEFGAMAPYWISRRLVEVTDGKVIDAGDVTGHEELTKDFIQKTGIEAVIEGRYFTPDAANGPLELYVDVINLKTNEKHNIGYFTGPRDNPSKVLDAATQRILSIWALSDKKRFEQSPPLYDAFREYEKASETWGTDYNKSRTHLERSYELDTTFYEPLVKLALSYGNAGNLLMQDSILQFIRAKDPELDRWTELRLEAADTRIRGNWEKALQANLEMIDIDPHELSAPYNASRYALILNKPRLALDILSQSTAMNKNLLVNDHGDCNWSMWVLASAHFKLQEYNEAYDLLDSMSCKVDDGALARNHIMACIYVGRFEELPVLIDKYGAGDVFWANGDTLTTINLTESACDQLYLMGHSDQLVTFAPALIDSKRSRWGYFYLGNYEKAYQLAKAHHQDTFDMGDLRWLAFFAAHARDTVSAMDYENRLERMPKHDYDRGRKSYLLAQVKAALGEKAAALDLLKQSAKEGRPHGFISVQMEFYPLHDYPPFQEFMRPKG